MNDNARARAFLAAVAGGGPLSKVLPLFNCSLIEQARFLGPRMQTALAEAPPERLALVADLGRRTLRRPLVELDPKGGHPAVLLYPALLGLCLTPLMSTYVLPAMGSLYVERQLTSPPDLSTVALILYLVAFGLGWVGTAFRVGRWSPLSILKATGPLARPTHKASLPGPPVGIELQLRWLAVAAEAGIDTSRLFQLDRKLGPRGQEEKEFLRIMLAHRDPLAATRAWAETRPMGLGRFAVRLTGERVSDVVARLAAIHSAMHDRPRVGLAQPIYLAGFAALVLATYLMTSSVFLRIAALGGAPWR